MGAGGRHAECIALERLKRRENMVVEHLDEVAEKLAKIGRHGGRTSLAAAE
jgi:hypothetical protein